MTLWWAVGTWGLFKSLGTGLQICRSNVPARQAFEAQCRNLAARLLTLQRPDGYWNPGLLGDPAKTLPESGGTACYVYGLAWGIRAGLLDAKVYTPNVRLGWQALVRAVHPNGKLGWVQPISDRPELNSYEDTQIYGVGGFLLAAGAVADLAPGAPR